MLWGYCEEHWGTFPSQFTYRHPPTSCQTVGSTPHQSPAVAGATLVPALSSSHRLTGNTRTDGWGVLGHHSCRNRRRVKVSALRSCACCLAPGLPGGCERVPGSEPGLCHPSSSQHPPELCPCSCRSFHKDHPTGVSGTVSNLTSVCAHGGLKIQRWGRVRRGSRHGSITQQDWVHGSRSSSPLQSPGQAHWKCCIVSCSALSRGVW